MNKLPVYHPGSSVVVMLRLRNRKNGPPIPLADYHTEAAFYTRLLGGRIRASDTDPDKIPITPLSHYLLKIEIPPGDTAKLPCGICSVKLTLTHKNDGSRLIVQKKLFTLKETIKDA